MLWRQGKAYSQDIRERVFACAKDGLSVCEVAKRLSVSVSYVSKVLGRLQSTGERTARPQRCHVPPKLAALYEAIRAEVAAKPDATIDELRDWLLASHGVTASQGLIFKTLDKLQLTLKKSHYTRLNRPGQMLRRRAMNGARPSRNSILAS